jgi:two-component system, NarL family, response regulator YdfI
MLTVAILSSDSTLRDALEQIMRNDRSLSLVRSADTPAMLLSFADINRIDVLLAAPQRGEHFDWSALRDRFGLVAILDGAEEESELEAFRSGASAVLDRTARPAEIVAAINAVGHGLFVGHQNTFQNLLGIAPSENKLPQSDSTQSPLLTRRELEVIAAMADGLSNKAIARRLGISFHTVKFHVAAILEKLGADTRTEAVTKAAQHGIVML